MPEPGSIAEPGSMADPGSMPQPGSILLVDLDGTLIRSNSYHSFLRWIALHPGASGGRYPATIAGFGAVLAQRRAGVVTRREMKQKLQRVAATVFDDSPRGRSNTVAFVATLLASADEEVAAVIDVARQVEAPVVLTTAAYPEYAQPLATHLGLDGVVATSFLGESDWTENLGEAKRRRTMRWLEEQGWAAVPRILLSDHEDDIPLAAECAAVWWVPGSGGPSEAVRHWSGALASGGETSTTLRDYASARR